MERGVYGVVLDAGRVAEGDPVSIEAVPDRQEGEQGADAREPEPKESRHAPLHRHPLRQPLGLCGRESRGDAGHRPALPRLDQGPC